MGQPLPSGQVDRQRHARDARGAGRGAQRLLFRRREGLRNADLADDARHGVGPGRAATHVVDDEGRSLVEVHAGEPVGVGRLEVEARAHDDVEPGAARDALQRFRVATDAEIRRVHDRVAAELRIAAEFAGREIDVEQEAIVPADERVHPQFADVLDADRRLGERHLRGLAGTLPELGGVEQDVLVHQRHAHAFGRDRSQHRHDGAAPNPDGGPGDVGHASLLTVFGRHRGRYGRSSRWPAG